MKLHELHYLRQPTFDASLVEQHLRSSFSVGDRNFEERFVLAEFFFFRGPMKDATDLFAFIDEKAPESFRKVAARRDSVISAMMGRYSGMIEGMKPKFFFIRSAAYQLVKLKEEILTYLSAGARQHLITAFWEYLILLEVAYTILEKDQNTYRHNHSLYDLYVKLRNTYELADFTTEGDFSERLIKISDALIKKYKSQFGSEDAQRLTAAQVTELLYRHDLKQLRSLISQYLQEKKSVWVLFDNLDKGWSTYGVDAIDAIVLRCLVDAGRKIERDMKRDQHDFHCIVFVRNDVYDTLMRHSADYGKESRAALDWNDPDMLREMLRLRLVIGMKGKLDKYDFNTVWRELCLSHYLGEETSSYLVDRSLMRPRNVLKIFNHCRGFATNFGRQKISDPDIDKGLTAYSHDLLEELDRELSDVFPGAKDLLYYFLDAPEVISGSHLESLLSEAKRMDTLNHRAQRWPVVNL